MVIGIIILLAVWLVGIPHPETQGVLTKIVYGYIGLVFIYGIWRFVENRKK